MGASLSGAIAHAAAGVLDLIYPPCCLLCEAEGEAAICEACAAEFVAIPEPVCHACGRPIDSGDCRFCATHRAATGADWAFQAARAGAVYEGSLRRAVHLLKYRGAEALGALLGAYLANRCVGEGLFPQADFRAVDAVVPMPMLPLRQRRRGYNQSLLLARPVAEMASLPLMSNAVRRLGRMAKAQVGLSLESRRSNVRPESFGVPDPAVVAGKTLLLVDDVFTTGTSANACALALRRAGAARVLVLSLAAGD